MTREEFVSTLRLEVCEQNISDCFGLLNKPPGRRPARGLLELSTKYKALPDAQKQLLHEFAVFFCDNSIFSILCILDGVRKVSDEEGEFRLSFDSVGKTSVITPSEGEYLHDVFQALRWPTDDVA